MSVIHKSFIFFVLIFSILFYQDQLINEYHQLVISALMIILFGIPHGAIDHLLFSETKKLSQGIFYLYYFGIMTLYLLLWIFFPVICLTIFLFLSAYHFGQSQFVMDIKEAQFSDYTLYLAWGSSILSGLFLYNHLELMELLNKYPDTLIFKHVFEKNMLQIILLISSFLSLFLIFLKLAKNKMSRRNTIEEITVLAIIHLAFWQIPLILAFTLYFVIMHSLKVVFQEFNYLLKLKRISNVRHFIGLLLPNTLVSVAFLGVLVLLYFNDVFNFSINLMLFVMISLITLPHAIVMDNFYTNLPFRNRNKN